jgi:flavorubredoxin
MNTQLKPGIHWVGYIDWSIRDFHSYNTKRGATYNSYLIQDEKNVLVDTVKYLYADKLLQNTAELVPLDKIDYVVCNHAEPDHASGLADVMNACPNATLVCNAKCLDALKAYMDGSNWKTQVVVSGDELSIGKRTLKFIFTPMVHWPESMFTYCPEEKLLFSMDAFGQHLATSERFDDELPLELILEEARTYYANIVMPYSAQVAKLLPSAAALDIDMIAPAHGVVWRKNIPAILEAYTAWAARKTKAKVMIVYDTMWNSTAIMADQIFKGACSVDGVSVEKMFVRASDLTQLADSALDCAAMAVGSATLNTKMMPAMAAALNYLGGLKPPVKFGFAFGSCGWGKGAMEEIAEILPKMGWELVAPGVKSKFRPTQEQLDACFEAGKLLAEKALG